MNFKRAWHHWRSTHAALTRRFTEACLNDVERTIKRLEAQHSGEIEVVLEAHLPWIQAWRGRSTRDRAIELFSLMRVWDTEHNNGVLIYICLADRTVEIIADRGFNQRVPSTAWGQVCTTMNAAFGNEQWADGLLRGVEAVGEIINRHFPASDGAANELPDRPILL